MAAGWSNNYQIFENGEFIFNYSQMNSQKTILSYSGKWTVDKDSNIIFTKINQTIIEGGSLVPVEGVENEYEIQGGETKTYPLKNSEVEKFKLSNYYKDASFYDIETIKIGETQFWKMQQDPKNYP